MIAELSNLKLVCRDPIEKVDNFTQAVNDDRHMWHLHHRLGLNHTVKELKDNNMYYHRPASELVFLNGCKDGEDVYLTHSGVHSQAKRSLQAEFEYQSMLERLGREQCKDNDIVANKMVFETWLEPILRYETIKTRMTLEMLAVHTGLSEKFVNDVLEE